MAKQIEGKRDPSTHRTPAQIREHTKTYGVKTRKKRAQRNAARRKLGLKKGDPRDAGHIKPLAKGGSNAKSNLKAQSRKSNRGHGTSPGK